MVTSRMGLKPTYSCRAGDPISPGSRRTAAVSVWQRQSRQWNGDTTAANTQTHIRGLRRLVAEMTARRATIKGLVPPGEFYFYSVIQTTSPNACYGLPLDVARQVSELDAEWSCSVWTAS